MGSWGHGVGEKRACGVERELFSSVHNDHFYKGLGLAEGS